MVAWIAPGEQGLKSGGAGEKLSSHLGLKAEGKSPCLASVSSTSITPPPPRLGQRELSLLVQFTLSIAGAPGWVKPQQVGDATGERWDGVLGQMETLRVTGSYEDPQLAEP